MPTNLQIEYSSTKSTICPYCHSQIPQQEIAMRCAECKSVYHVSCWAELDKCGLFGCEETLAHAVSYNNISGKGSQGHWLPINVKSAPYVLGAKPVPHVLSAKPAPHVSAQESLDIEMILAVTLWGILLFLFEGILLRTGVFIGLIIGLLSFAIIVYFTYILFKMIRKNTTPNE